MTRKTIRITCLPDGLAMWAEIGPREPFHKATLATDDLPAHLRQSGVPEAEIEEILAVFHRNGWVITSFLPDIPAALTNNDRVLRAEQKKRRVKLLARVKSSEKAYLAAEAEFKSVSSQHAAIEDSGSALVVLRSARKELDALDRYVAAILAYRSFSESRVESAFAAAKRG